MLNLDITIIIIIAANVLISLRGFNDMSFFERFKFHIGGIRQGQQIRMISSAFLHADTMHLFFNMFTLYFFAPLVVQYAGQFQFILIYFGSLLVGNLLSFLFHKDEYQYSAVGASGAVSGIIYAGILFRPDMSLYLMFIPIPIPAYVFGIGYLLYSIFGMKNKIGNVGHDAHFGGAVGGYVITLALFPSLIQQHLLMVILLAIPIIILFIMQRLGKL